MKMNTNIINNDLDPCLDEQELRAYAAGEDTGVRDRSIVRSHLNICDACRERFVVSTEQPDCLENLVKRSVQVFRDKHEQIRQATKRGPLPGTIWRAQTNPDAQDELIGPLVLVLSSEDTPDGQVLSVVEVSEALDQAMDSDILILPQGSRLPLPAIIRTENAFRMRRERLHSFASELLDALWKNVRVLVAERQQVQHNAIPVPGTDPRFDFLQAGIRKCRYLAIDERAAVREQQSPLTDHTRPVTESSVNMTLDSLGEWLKDLGTQVGSCGQSMLHLLVNPPLLQAKAVTRGTVTPDTPRRFSVGEEMSFAIIAPADGYLVIFHHAEGALPELVFPNRYQRNNSVVGGQRAPWPPIRWGVDGPSGKQYFTAIWTSTQLLDLWQLDLEAEHVLAANVKLIQAFRDSLIGLSQDERDELVWDFAVVGHDDDK
jgi:hypothetical protein